MSVFLITSSLVTTLLIPPAEFEAGGEANGRALAYLAHEYLGDAFGTVYDVSTIAILWFAGASAMAGLLNLVPRYLPRYGMAPDWARAVRPLVLVFTGDRLPRHLDLRRRRRRPGRRLRHRRAGADHLGRDRRDALRPPRAASGGRTVAFGVITVVFVYTTVVNVIERPDGVKIAACFIAGDHRGLAGLPARPRLRAAGHHDVDLDETAGSFVATAPAARSGSSPTSPTTATADEYRDKIAQIAPDHDLPDDPDVIFVEVTVTDPSEFEAELDVRGEVMHGRYRVLDLRVRVGRRTRSPPCCCTSATSPASRPHIYFEWTEGNPVANFLRFLLFGAGRGRPGHPRGAAPGRARPRPPPARARRLMCEWGHPWAASGSFPDGSWPSSAPAS